MPENLVADFGVSLMLNRGKSLVKDVNISISPLRTRIGFPGLERSSPEWQSNGKNFLLYSIFQKTTKIFN